MQLLQKIKDKLTWSKRGMSGVWTTLSAFALGIVVFTFIVGFGALFLAQLAANATVAADGNATAAVNNGQTGLTSLSSWTSILVIAGVFVVILGMIALIGLGGYAMYKNR